MKRVVTKEEEGMTLLSFLRLHHAEKFSVKQLKSFIDKKCCSVGGLPERFSTRKLLKGEVVELKAKEESSSCKILYEDGDFLICDKASGVLSDAPSLIKSMDLKISLILVHRLDKETSGVLILAKSKRMYEEMVTLFKEKKVEKEYIALVQGEFKKQEGTINRPLKVKKKLKNQTLYTVADKGTSALTFWRCLKTGKGISLLLCGPVTGRTHQLRVHLQSIGHPILGDSLYGTTGKYSRLLLHAYKISFPHPRTGKKIQVIAPLPEIFKVTFPFKIGNEKAEGKSSEATC